MPIERSEALARFARGPLLLDGAMGTTLFAMGISPAELGRAALDHPEAVAAVHRGFVEAGAQAIATHSFAVPHALFTEAIDEVEAAARLDASVRCGRAALAAAPGAWLLGAVGPLGLRREEVGRLGAAPFTDAPTAADEPLTRRCFDVYRRVTERLVEAGVDLLRLETFGSTIEASLAVAAARLTGATIVVQGVFGSDGRLLDGRTPAAFAEATRAAGADVIGAGCGAAIEHATRAVEELALALPEGFPRSFAPSAGLPRGTAAALDYPEAPTAFAAVGARLRARPPAMAGGCCGTTPAHLRALDAGLRGRS
jgi:methionine synthase I (cobalamin-dependent)